MKWIIALLLLPFTVTAQINSQFTVAAHIFHDKFEYSGSGLFGFIDNGQLGYMDKNQKIIIPTSSEIGKGKYGNIPKFNNGYGIFKKEDKYGLVDKTGKTVIPYEYNSISFFPTANYIAIVSKKEGTKSNYGVVSIHNKTIVPLTYDMISVSGSYIIVKKDGLYGVKDITGKDLLPIEYKVLYVYPEDKVAKVKKDDDYGFIDLNGNWLFKKSSAVYDLYSCNQGLILCKVNNKFGYLNLKGEEVIATQYDRAGDFDETGMAKVGYYNGNTNYITRYGYINKQGKVIIPIEYKNLSYFKNGYAFAQDPTTNRYGYLDTKGNWLLKPIYIFTSSLFDNYGGTWVKMTDNKYHYIDKKGKDYGTLDESGSSPQSFTDEYAVYSDETRPYTLIDSKGKTVKIIDDCKNIYSFSGGLAGYQSKENDLYGFVDMKGNKIGKAEYTGFNGFQNGFSRVIKKINGASKSGYIDTKGKIIIPFIYDVATSFEDGWAVVSKDSQFYFVDPSGNEKPTPRKYDKLVAFRSGFAMGTIEDSSKKNTYYYINKNLKEAFSIEAKQGYNFQENIAVINRTGVYELMDTKGNPYKELTDIEVVKFPKEGLLGVRKDKKWGFIDKTGKQVVPFLYEDCDSYVGNYAKIKQDDKWGIIDKTGKVIIAPKYDNIVPNEEGIFIYYQDSYYGIIDKNGKIISSPNYYPLTPFYKGVAIGKEKKSFVIIHSPLAK